MEQIDASLTRLGTDYVDLYQIHRFDPDTPVEETMEALHDVVKAGKVQATAPTGRCHASPAPGRARACCPRRGRRLRHRRDAIAGTR